MGVDDRPRILGRYRFHQFLTRVLCTAGSAARGLPTDSAGGRDRAVLLDGGGAQAVRGLLQGQSHGSVCTPTCGKPWTTARCPSEWRASISVDLVSHGKKSNLVLSACVRAKECRGRRGLTKRPSCVPPLSRTAGRPHVPTLDEPAGHDGVGRLDLRAAGQRHLC